MSIEKELNTLALVEQSSAIGYFFKRIYYTSIFYLGKKYDKNILAILDAAIQSKRYEFVHQLSEELKELKELGNTKQTDKEIFLKKLLKAFNDHVNKPSYQAEDPGLKLIKKAINKYIDDNDFYQRYRISKPNIDSVNQDNTTKRYRDARRRNKTLLGVVAFALAFLVAFPEGALAVYGFGLFSFGPVLLFGLSAFAVSYFLYKADIYNFLKNIFYPSTNLQQEQKLSKTEEYVLQFLIIFAGLAMGVLLFSSIYVPAGMLIFGFASAAALFAAPITGSLALLIAGSAFFAAITALANVALFKPILDITYKDFKKYFNINSFSDLRSNIKSFEFSSLFSIKTVIVALSGMVMVFGQLWFGSEAYKILNVMMGLSQKTSIISAAVISVLGVTNGLFYGKNLYQFLTSSKDYMVGLFKNSKVEQLVGEVSCKSEDDFNVNQKRNMIKISRYAVIAILVACCIGNATGVATGVAALMGSYFILKKLAFGLVSTASFSANAKASYEAFALPVCEPAVNLTAQSRLDKPLATLPKRYTVYFNRETDRAGGAGQSSFEPMFSVPAAPAA